MFGWLEAVAVTYHTLGSLLFWLGKIFVVL